jgi:PAS domain S-box-containing protein
LLPFSEQTHKIVNIVSMVIAAILLSVYVLLAIFTKSSIVFYDGMRFAIGFSVLILLYGIAFNSFYERNDKLTLGGLILLDSIMPLFLIDYLGGPLTPYVFLVYFTLIVGFMMNTFYGISILVAASVYLGVSFFTRPGISFEFAGIFASFIVLSLFFAYFGRKYRDTVKQSQELEKSNLDLSASKNKEEALLAGIADGVYVVDMERNLTMFNDAAEEMTGWKDQEAIGLKCWTVMNLKTETEVSICQKDCPAMSVWNTGTNIMRDDTCFIKKRGNKKVQISSSYSPIKDKNGKLTGAICVFRDITSRKEVERQRNEFVSTASHELRTPITAMEGYMELIENQKICKIDEKAQDYVTKARNTARGMSSLVKNLLAVTKIEEGKIETNITHFSIHDLVAETIEAMGPAAKSKNLYLKIIESTNPRIRGEKAVGRSLNVVADREQIREVLYNLIENGLKFSADGGVAISITYDNDYATIEVSDTGIGISADGQKHLFEKFYRVDNTATREAGGTGLGLFITRSIIEMFGGNIWVESQANKGTKFFFTIPRSLD